MSEEFIKAFDSLSINEKRNQLNREMLIIANLLESLERLVGINNTVNIKNYNSNVDGQLNESEMLTFLYEGIYAIERELIYYLSNNKIS